MRAPRDVEDLIRRLERWRAARARIAQSPERQGKPLPNTELDDAITYLTEYRRVCEGLA